MAGRKIKRKIVLAAVDADTGEFVTFTEEDTSASEMREVCLASCAMPFFFPLHQINGRNLIDGGSVWNTNVISAVERCREQVSDDS